MNKCSETKPLSKFYKRKDSKDGFRNDCILCIKKQRKQYHENNQEKIKEAQKVYYQKNKEQLLKNMKHYRENNKETIEEHQKHYRKENREKINEYLSKRYYSDKQFRNNNNLHSRINKLIKGEDNSLKTQELLGCNLEWLKKWLEYQFTPEMSWNNRGIYWDLEHLLPCASFNLSDYNEQKRCFNWSNTQPLEKIANIKKGNKRNIELEMQHYIKVQKFKELMNTQLL